MSYILFTKIKKIVLILIAVYLISLREAFAYIDPNMGGFTFQFLFPIFSAICIAYLFLKNQIKKLYNNIAGFIKKKLRKNSLTD